MHSHRLEAPAIAATALRSVLRYLYLQGRIDVDLSIAVPSTTGSRRTSLPKALAPAEVRRVLRGCDRRRHMGRRSSAVLLLTVRWGLRAVEAASLDEIAQILRHRSHNTTTIYAKVDRNAVHAVVRPWPGAGS